MLEKAKNPTYRPSAVITAYANDHNGGSLGSDLEDRLMRAYVDGYKIVEPTKYNVKVPHCDWYYYELQADGLEPTTVLENEDGYQTQFTMAEIKHYGLEDCERLEINAEDSDE